METQNKEIKTSFSASQANNAGDVVSCGISQWKLEFEGWRKKRSDQKTNRGKQGRFGPIRVFSTPGSCPACRPEHFPSVKSKIRWLGAQFWPKYVFLLRLTDPAGNDIGFRRTESIVYLFGLVVSFSAHIYIYIYMYHIRKFIIWLNASKYRT